MAKFVIKKSPKGYTFQLKAGNGETIGTGGEVYTTKDACEKGVQSVKTNAPKANTEDQTVSPIEKENCPKFELYKDVSSNYRFRLLATNGQNILASEAYTTKDACKNGIDSVKKNAPIATVEEEE